MGQRYADEGKIHHKLHPVPLTLSVFYMLNDWISCNDDFCADNEVFLYGDITIKVDRGRVEVLPRDVPPPWFFTQLGNGSHTIFELCLLFERGMGMNMPLTVPVSSGKFSGTCVSTAPALEHAVLSFS